MFSFDSYSTGNNRCFLLIPITQVTTGVFLFPVCNNLRWVFLIYFVSYSTGNLKCFLVGFVF